MVPQKKRQKSEAVGKSYGGLSTKIHATVDALGNPLRLLLTEGQASEYGQSEALIKGCFADYMLADKGYNSNRFVAAVRVTKTVPVIPGRKNRCQIRDYDKELYKERNLVDHFFQKLKGFRRIATRYERLVRNDQAILSLVASVICPA